MQAFLKGSSCFWVLKQYLFCPSSHRLVSGLRCCVEIPATSTSVPSLAVRLLSAAGDGVLVPLCEGGFLCILLLFSAQQSLEGLERKEKQHTLTSLPLSLWVGCLSASLGYTLLIIFAGADYGHSCSSHEVQSLNFTAGLQNILFNHLCRWAENAPLCILPSFLSFPFFFFLPCAMKMTALQVFPTHFFLPFCSLLCSHASLRSQPSLGSWEGVWFQEEVMSCCCSCERCSDAILLYLLRDFMGTSWCVLQHAAETILHHTAMQVWVNSCFICKGEALDTAVFLTTCLHYFS